MAQVLPNVECDIDWENLPVQNAYVMGFRRGDLVQTIRSLRSHSGAGGTIPPYSVGTIQAVTINMAQVHFMYYSTRMIKLEDLEYATDYKLAPTRLSSKRKDGSKR